jgi:secondary thiamine-phosphate synthase enzyme
VQADAIQMTRELVPRDRPFTHSEGNSDAHVKAMLVGASATLPVSGGQLELGRWQAVFLCEFDGPRERELWVSVR